MELGPVRGIFGIRGKNFVDFLVLVDIVEKRIFFKRKEFGRVNFAAFF